MSKELPRIDYGAHPLYGGMFKPDPRLGELMAQALQGLIEQTDEVEQQRAQQFGYRYRWNDERSQDLAVRGVSKAQLPNVTVDRLNSAAKPLIELIQARIAAARASGEPIKYKTALEPTSPTSHPELWRLVDDALRDIGLHETTATVFDAPSAKLRSVAALVNHPNQEWATNLYRDVDVETPPTAGFHIDSDAKCFTKIVLYLTDVGAEQGPFGIIPESHRWGEGSRDRIYRSAFDKSDQVVRSAKRRRMFLSLPEEMRVKAEFGGDMIPGSPEAEDMLAQEQVMTGPRGQMNLFNPDAIHRGGNVERGRRHVLLISVGPRWHPSQT